jgi:hypothetical protein
MGDGMPDLNEKTVRALPAPQMGNKVYRFTGAILQGVRVPPGFGVCVTANDARSFVLDYRNRQRAQRRITIRQWPTWSALAAVKEARELIQRVDRGEDPLAERAKQETTNTFKTISQEYFSRDGKELRTREHRERTLKRLVYPMLGDRDIATIKRSELVRLLDQIETANGPVMADRALAYVRKVFNWHASRSDDFRSPIVTRHGPHQQQRPGPTAHPQR